jgi:hypothetical protein
VKDAKLVRGRKASAELARDLKALVSGQPANAPQQRGQVFSVHVFHGEEDAAVGFAYIENPADIGMRNLASETHFGVKSIQCGFVPGKIHRQKLQGNGLAEFQVIGPVDFAHTAFADEGDDAVAL